jgi:hypothetical protein
MVSEVLELFAVESSPDLFQEALTDRLHLSVIPALSRSARYCFSQVITNTAIMSGEE